MSLETLIRIGTIPIVGDIEFPNMTPIINSLLYATVIAKSKQELPEKLSVYVHSSGGDFNIAVGIVDLLRNLSESGISIHTYAFGQVASSGLLVFSAGDKRIAFPNTSFCIHHVWDEETKSIDEIETEKYLRILSERTDIAFDDLHKQIKWPDGTPFEWTFDCDTAKEMGLINSPIGSKIIEDMDWISRDMAKIRKE